MLHSLRPVLVLVAALLIIPASTQANFRSAVPYLSYETGQDPVSLTSADFDEDGRVDLVSANVLRNAAGFAGSPIRLLVRRAPAKRKSGAPRQASRDARRRS
jgi:hypothetical protein